MRARRNSSLDRSCFISDPRPPAVECLLAACIIGLCLVWVAGCPSKPSPDANKPGEQKTQDTRQKTENGGQIKKAGQQPAVQDGPVGTLTHYSYKVIRTYPHDPQAFTQGLVYEDGVLYEGTGLYGESSLTKRELETATVLKRERLPRRYFGEGIAVFGDRVIQLTWKSQTGFVYDKTTFHLLREFKYEGEGWGLTQDGKQLIMSDGTAALRFLDPNTFAETRRITVRDEEGPVDQLNELEFIDGRIFANIWTSDSIAIIAPDTGRVAAWLDLSALYPRPAGSEAVLNGIAYLPQSHHLLITGKLWPKLYEIELSPHPPEEQR
jgi:glutamine cyclotransferase